MKGAGPISAEVIAQTLEDGEFPFYYNASTQLNCLVPEAAPRDIHCSTSTPESIEVSWQPPPDDKVHGVIQGYRLYYESVDDPSNNI
jgi:Fibronectin type III domain